MEEIDAWKALASLLIEQLVARGEPDAVRECLRALAIENHMEGRPPTGLRHQVEEMIASSPAMS